MVWIHIQRQGNVVAILDLQMHVTVLPTNPKYELLLAVSALNKFSVKVTKKRKKVHHDGTGYRRTEEEEHGEEQEMPYVK